MRKSVKLALMALPFIGIGATCAIVGDEAVPAYAEDNISSIAETAESIGSEVSESAAESSEAIASSKAADPDEAKYDERLEELEEKISYVKKWADDKWNTYVAPLVGGVSLAVVLSFIGTIVMNYVKGKGIDKKMLESNERLNAFIESSKTELNEKMAAVEEKMALASEALAKVTEVASTMTSIKETVEKGERISEETKEKLESQVTSLSKTLNEMTDEVSSLDDVKKAMAVLSQIIAALAKCSDEAIKNGSASEVAKLAELTKEL